jgi:hypothetical protein
VRSRKHRRPSADHCPSAIPRCDLQTRMRQGEEPSQQRRVLAACALSIPRQRTRRPRGGVAAPSFRSVGLRPPRHPWRSEGRQQRASGVGVGGCARELVGPGGGFSGFAGGRATSPAAVPMSPPRVFTGRPLYSFIYPPKLDRDY